MVGEARTQYILSLFRGPFHWVSCFLVICFLRVFPVFHSASGQTGPRLQPPHTRGRCAAAAAAFAITLGYLETGELERGPAEARPQKESFIPRQRMDAEGSTGAGGRGTGVGWLPWHKTRGQGGADGDEKF